MVLNPRAPRSAAWGLCLASLGCARPAPAAPVRVLHRPLPSYELDQLKGAQLAAEAPAGPLPAGQLSAEPLPAAAEATPRASAPAALSLAHVVETVVLQDPRIRAAFAPVLQQQAELLRARTLNNPELTLSQTLNPLPGQHFDAQTRQGGPPQLDVGVSYSLERLLFGQRQSAVRTARQEVEAALLEYADLARQRVLEAIAAYVDVLAAKALYELATEDVSQLERMGSITERRVALGSVGRVEADRMHIAVFAGRRRALQAKAEVDNARSRLRARLGPAYRATSVEVAGSLEAVPRALPGLEALVERALNSRPDLLASERRVLAAEARIRREQRRAFPKLGVGLGYTRQFQKRAIGFPDANSWGATLALGLPVLDRNQAGIAGARGDLFQADAELTALQLEVRAEVEQALRTAQVAGEILLSFEPETRKAAEAVRSTIQEAYALGGRTLLELLDAQHAYRDVLREEVLARADYLRAIYGLNASVGDEVVR